MSASVQRRIIRSAYRKNRPYGSSARNTSSAERAEHEPSPMTGEGNDRRRVRVALEAREAMRVLSAMFKSVLKGKSL